MTTLLVVALVAPGFGVLATVAAPGRRAGALLAASGVLTALAWAAIVVGGGASIGRFHAPPLVAAAAAGGGLVAATIGRRRRLERVLPVGLAVGALGAGLTLGLVDGRGGVLLATLAIIAVLLVSGERGRDLLVIGGLGLLGLALFGIGLAVAHGDLDSWSLPGVLAPGVPVRESVRMSTAAAALMLAGCTALAVAGTVRGRPVDALLWIGAGAIAIRVVGAFASPNAPEAQLHDGLVPWLAVALAAAAVAAAIAAPPPLPVALLAIAALAGPTTAVGAAALLGTAAVLCAVAPVPWTMGAAIPGAVAMAAALRSEPGLVGGALALALAAVASLVGWRLWLSRAPMPPAASLPLVVLVGMALAAWLAVAPSAWAWTAPGLLRDYQEGALPALAGALLMLVGGALTAWRRDSPPRRNPSAHDA